MLLDYLAEFSVRRYRSILAVTLCIVLVSLGGLRQLLFSHDALVWLPKDLDVRQATELYDRELRGSVVLEIILDTGTENGLYDRQVLLDAIRVGALVVGTVDPQLAGAWVYRE